MATMTNKTNRICIGEISTVHGVRGLVKVRAYGNDAEALEKYGPLFTSETGNGVHTLTLKHQAGGVWVAEVKGIADRDTAEKLRGTKLWLDRAALPDLEGEYYHADLIGLSVVDEAGQNIGTVVAVENFGAGDLLDIKPDGRATFYLPFADSFVLDVDLGSGTITVEIPEGLVEE